MTACAVRVLVMCDAEETWSRHESHVAARAIVASADEPRNTTVEQSDGAADNGIVHLNIAAMPGFG